MVWRGREGGKECVFLEVRTIAVVGREIAVVDGTAVIYASAAKRPKPLCDM
jgi:hypothetical protein